MSLSTPRKLFAFLLAVTAINSLLWLDSFDRYLNSRYHFNLASFLPEESFKPSKDFQSLLAVIQTNPFPAAKKANRTKPSSPPIASTQEADTNKPVEMSLASVPTEKAAAAQSGSQTISPQTTAAQTTTQQSTPSQTTTPQPSTMPAPVAQTTTPATTIATAPVTPTTPPVPEITRPTAITPSINIPAQPIPEPKAATMSDVFPKVLFAGDSMMQGVAPIVIGQMRKDYPKGKFVDLSMQSTGLTVKRYFDWPTKIREETLKQGFKIVVIFLGPNDPWDISEGNKRYIFPSEEWKEKYRERVIEVMEFADSQNVHVIWIGLPNMREDRVKRGAVVQNVIFREEAQRFNFDYLSTEDLLGRLDEPFKRFVDDPQKGQLATRAEDGIHFTPTGLRMISAKVIELIKKQEQ